MLKISKEKSNAMNCFSIWLGLIVGRGPFVVNYQTMMNSNTSVTPLQFFTVHSERPEDPNLSCHMVNTSWFCTDDFVLLSSVDKDDSY